MPDDAEVDGIELDRRAPTREESSSKLPLNNTRALLRLALGDEAILAHDKSIEVAARVSSRSAPDIGVN